jgi:hypothetical protein
VNSQGTVTRFVLAATRIWLPLIIAAGGVVMIVLGHGRTKGTGATALGNSIAAGGVALLIAALIVWMINWLFRLSVQSNRDREQEEAARAYFDRHGRWPDSGESAGADSLGSFPGGKLPGGPG